MKFEKGNKSGKGRPKGALNKDSEFKKFLKDKFEENKDRMFREIAELKGKQYLDAMFALMEYIQPKLSRTEVTAEIETEIKPQTIKFVGLKENKTN